MTDTELKRRKAICEVANVSDIGDLSDGFHTFNGLYYQRMILFASLVRAYKDRAWKSYRHEDGGLCFGGGWFIVGIDTPEGSYTYHYENKDFDRFDCVELPCGKHWDGHTEDDVTRLLSLPTVSLDEVQGVGCDAADRLAAYEDTGLEPEEINDICHRFSCFLSEMTRNRMSKLNYTLEAMIQCAQDAHELDCEDYCFLKQAEKEETENGM